MKQADLMVARAICLKLQVNDRKAGVELIANALAEVRRDEQAKVVTAARQVLVMAGCDERAEQLLADSLAK